MKETPLRNAREKRGISQRQLSLETGIPRTVLQRIERGEAMVKQVHARALYSYFNGELTLGQIYDPAFAQDTVAMRE